MSADQDTEITLGTGKMLVLFFGLVALCAVFFGLGFSMGRSASKPAASAETAASSAAATRLQTSRPASSDAAKPADLTFCRAVDRKDANRQLARAAAGSSTAPAAVQPAASAQAPRPDPTNFPGAG